MQEHLTPIENSKNEMTTILTKMIEIGARAKTLRDAGFRYATIRFTKDGDKLIPHVGALHYEGDSRMDKTAPFMASVYGIGDGHGGMNFGGDTEDGNSPLVTADGSKFSEGTINASKGSEYTGSYTQLRATFL